MTHAAAPPVLAGEIPLPQYDHPPLVEVTLSARWNFAQRIDENLGREFLERLGPAWQPACAVEPTHSRLSQSWSAPPLALESVLGEQRLELSADGFEYTWDGRQGDMYPRYESIRDGFVIALDAWQDCLAAAGLEPPLCSGWQVSYLNRIPQGTVWNSLADCGFLRLMAPLPAGLPRLDRHEGHWYFSLDRPHSLLRCELRTTGGAAGDPRLCLWLRLTCHGGLDGPDSSILEGLDYGRQTIVKTFRQLMSPAANAYWELQRDA